ncbi:MAG: hypothetical protein QOF84_1264 [Streptomyces sp.]|jgi:hypothetical protein|nr:hypothetical protein [Streptomyces sp.]
MNRRSWPGSTSSTPPEPGTRAEAIAAAARVPATPIRTSRPRSATTRRRSSSANSSGDRLK